MSPPRVGRALGVAVRVVAGAAVLALVGSSLPLVGPAWAAGEVGEPPRFDLEVPPEEEWDAFDEDTGPEPGPVRNHAGLPPAQWPEGGTGTVPVGLPEVFAGWAGFARTLALGAELPQSHVVGGLPVVLAAPAPQEHGLRSYLGRPDPGASGTASVDVEVFDQDTSRAAGVEGVLLRVRLPDGQPAADLVLGGVYAPFTEEGGTQRLGFGQAFGGDYGSRLRLVRVPDCVVETPEDEACQVGVDVSLANLADVPLPEQVPGTVGAVTGSVDLGAEPAVEGFGAVPFDTAEGTGTFALVPGASSSAGSYAATPLNQASSWQVAEQTGAFSWSHELTLPVVPGPLQPSLSLSYSSQAVDGLTSASNNQASWVGDGFSMWSGYIERSYEPCSSDDAASSSRFPDLCFDEDKPSLVFGGRSGRLVETGTDEFVLENDPSTKVFRHYGGDNADDDGEYFEVATPDGVRYFFGRESVPGRSASTESLFTVPVAGDEAGEPCFDAGSHAKSFCVQGWRWNLDYAVDTSGNVQVYTYAKEQNYYRFNGGTAGGTSLDLDGGNAPYTAGGVMVSLLYGLREDGPPDAVAPARVLFTSGSRCDLTQNTPIDADVPEFADFRSQWCDPAPAGEMPEVDAPRQWRDTPTDRICRPGDAGRCDPPAPTFFTTMRLESVSAQAYAADTTSAARLLGGAGAPERVAAAVQVYADEAAARDMDGDYEVVEEWELRHEFAAGSGAATAPVLWLHSLDRASWDNLSPIRFSAISLPNRVDALQDGAPALYRDRISSIRTETGATVALRYGSECTPGTVPGTGDAVLRDNTKVCFPAKYAPVAYRDPTIHFFHKYVVTEYSEGTGVDGAANAQVTQYHYGPAAWARPDVPHVKPQDLTFSEFRGFAEVVSVRGPREVDNPPQVTVQRFLRGMGGTVTAADGTEIDDVKETQGFAYETSTFSGAGVGTDGEPDDASGGVTDETTLTGRGTLVRTVVHTPLLDLSGPDPDDEDNRAHVLRTSTSSTITRGTGEDGTGTMTTRVSSAYDEQGYGLVVSVDDEGDVTVEGDERCTTTTYAQNTDDEVWLVGLPATSIITEGRCGGNGEVLSGSRSRYDGSTSGTDPPTRGLVTGADGLAEATSADPADLTWLQRATTGYDERGRATTTTVHTGSTDATTTTSYTETPAGLTDTIVVTSPLGHERTTVMDPTTGLPVAETDPNGQVTSLQYTTGDRLEAVWLPGHPKVDHPDTPNIRYTYLLEGTTYGQDDVALDRPLAVVTETWLDGGRHNPDSYVVDSVSYDQLGRPVQTMSTAADLSDGHGFSNDNLDGDPSVVVTRTGYDTAGRVVVSYGPSAAVMDDQDIATGLLVDLFSADVAEATRTVSTFDGMGRPLTRVTDHPVPGTGARTVIAESSAVHGGDRTTITPPEGATATTQVIDARGRPAELRELTPDGPDPERVTRYAYDAADRLVEVVDPAGSTSSSTYDMLGRRLSTTSPDAGTVTSTYDDADRVLTVTDATGTTLHTSYDLQSRPTHVRIGDANGPVLTALTYDDPDVPNSIGRATAASRTTGGITLTESTAGFTAAGRPTATTLSVPDEGLFTGMGGDYTTSFSYLADGRIEAVALPAAADLPVEVLHYTYDSQGRPREMHGERGYVQETYYTAYGETARLTLGSQVGGFTWIDHAYEPGTRRLTDLRVKREGTTGFDQHLAYTYDQAGNILTATDAPSPASTTFAGVRTECYTYDDLRRLTAAWTHPATPEDCTGGAADITVPGGYQQAFTFDTASNRATSTTTTGDGPITATHTYPDPTATTNPVHAPTTVATTGPNGDTTQTFTYDASGRTLTTTTTPPTGNPDTLTHTYTPDGFLAAYGEDTTGDGDPDHDRVDIVHGPDGSRLARQYTDPNTAALATTLHIGAHTEITTHALDGTTATRHYEYDGRPVATRTGDEVQFLITDPHNTATTAITDTTDPATGQTSLTRRYRDPHGNLLTETPNGAWPTTRGFLNAPEDPHGYTHLGARHYNPTLGQFTTPDPITDHTNSVQAQGYNYAGHNPITYTDPTGLFLGSIIDWVGGLLGGRPQEPSSPSSAASTTGSSGSSRGNAATSAADPATANTSHTTPPTQNAGGGGGLFADLKPTLTHVVDRTVEAATNFADEHPIVAGVAKFAYQMTPIADVVNCVGGDILSCGMALISVIPPAAGSLVSLAAKGVAKTAKALTQTARATKTTNKVEQAAATTPPSTRKTSTDSHTEPETSTHSIQPMKGAAKAGAGAGDDLTRLYRAVDPAELKDLVGTGVYRSAPGGTEGKYFFPTKAQAENFSNLMGKTGTGPYCITSGCIPRSTLSGIQTIHPAGEGTAYFIPRNVLPQFRDIIIHGPQ